MSGSSCYQVIGQNFAMLCSLCPKCLGSKTNLIHSQRVDQFEVSSVTDYTLNPTNNKMNGYDMETWKDLIKLCIQFVGISRQIDVKI